jgi:3-oxoacyl-[acyl-carrier-protein] synthase-3
MAVPERKVSNEEIAPRIGVDTAWIAKRTGTLSRPWAHDGERMSDFAAAAGRGALTRAGVDAGEVDLVLVATSTADEITPNAAPLVAGLLGASRAGAFDVGAACTGWLAGLGMACGQIESGRARCALVVGADFCRGSSTSPTVTRHRCSRTARVPSWSVRAAGPADGLAPSCCAPTPPALT